ncbi:retrovirus-related pol polyprotein from transposon TNT 1-94 [Tanacetum coccineum]
MLAPKCPTFNGRPTFANPMYLKKSQYEKQCLYEIPHDQSDPANRLVPDREETLTLERESRSKLNKDLVKPYDYTKLNSLYEIFKPLTQEYLVQLAHANEVRKKLWRKSFVKMKPNIFKNIDFLPVSKSISKSRQAYNVMTNNISHLKDIVDQAWVKHSNDHINLRPPTAQDMQILIKTCLMPLALKTQNDSFAFVHELKQEMHADLKYVESLEDEIDELESDKAEFSNMYDMLLQECVSNDVMCSYLHSLSALDAYNELQCLYLHKVKECDCLAQKLSKQTKFVSKEVYTELLRNFAKLEKHSISLELTLQQCQEQMKNDTVYKEKASNVFQKEREQYFEIQDLKANLQDKNIAIRVAHRTNVSRPKPRSNQIKDKVMPNTSHVKFKKIEVEGKLLGFLIVQLILFIVDSGCTKHMTGNLPLLCNFVEKYPGTVRFGNDQFTSILGYEDLVQENIMINRVYHVEGLNHNLFSVGQFCDANLEVDFQKSTCFVKDLQGNDLLTGNRGSDLYTISLQETTSSTPIYLMAKASPTQAWLWHRSLSHLNFNDINLLSKRDVVIGLPKFKYVKDQLCSSCEVGPMRVASINGKKYTLVIIDDYSRYMWTLFLHSKDETLEVLKDFLTMIQRNLQAPVIYVRTDRGTEFLNKTLNAFFKQEGIEHQTSTSRTPKQNGVVERRNHTLVEAARMMLSASKLPLDGENLDKDDNGKRGSVHLGRILYSVKGISYGREKRNFLWFPEGGGLCCTNRTDSLNPDHPEKRLPFKEEALYGLKNKLQRGPMSIMRFVRDTAKVVWKDTVLGDKLVAGIKKQDTTSRLWLQLQQNTVVLRLSISHSNLMQPRAALRTSKPFSVSLPKGTALPKLVSVSCQANWYEMFDSSRTGGSDK